MKASRVGVVKRDESPQILLVFKQNFLKNLGNKLDLDIVIQ